MSGNIKKDIVSAQMRVTNDVIGAWKSQILFTLNELNVITALEKQPKFADVLSQELQLPEDSLHRLLDASVGVGYLLKSNQGYTVAPYIQAVLFEKSEGYLGNWLKMYAHWYSTFGKLTQSVRDGRAVEDVNSVVDEDYHHVFVKGMTDYANYRGRELIQYIDLGFAGKLLDVGCGPGIYVAMFCEKYPNIRCTCYDVPQALRLAREYLDARGFLDRINFRPGNYLEDTSFGESEYEAILLSHVLHQESASTCLNILRKAFVALKPGGTVIVQAMYLNDTRTGPVYASLHDLLSLMIFREGRNYTYKEIMALLTEANFTNVRRKSMSMFNVNGLVLGEKGA